MCNWKKKKKKKNGAIIYLLLVPFSFSNTLKFFLGEIKISRNSLKFEKMCLLFPCLKLLLMRMKITHLRLLFSFECLNFFSWCFGSILILDITPNLKAQSNKLTDSIPMWLRLDYVSCPSQHLSTDAKMSRGNFLEIHKKIFYEHWGETEVCRFFTLSFCFVIGVLTQFLLVGYFATFEWIQII